MKNKKRKVWIIVTAVILVIFAGIGSFVYLTLFVGPRDLNVKYTQEDYDRLLQKFGYKIPDDFSTEKYKMSFAGRKESKMDITQEEFTALLNADGFADDALKDAQVKFNGNGTLETSAEVNMDFIKENILSEDQLKSIPSFIVPEKAPLYIKADLSIVDGKFNIDPENIKIGATDVPSSLITDETIKRIENSLENAMAQNPDLKINNLKVEDGKIIFDGVIPDNINFESK